MGIDLDISRIIGTLVSLIALFCWIVSVATNKKTTTSGKWMSIAITLFIVGNWIAILWVKTI